MRIRRDAGEAFPMWEHVFVLAIVLLTFYPTATEDGLRQNTLLAREPAQEASSQPAPAQAGGQPPARIQKKLQQLQATVHKLKAEGRDISSVREIVHEFRPLMDAGKFQEAEAVLDRALARAGDLSSAEPGGPPASLQQKMARLQELAQQRQQAGGDMEPVVAIADGVQPLLDQHKYSEAEAQVDRAIALIIQTSPAGEQPAATNNGGQTAAIPADAKPLACPGAGAAADLASGVWALRSACTVNGLNLRGDAQLWAEGVALRVDGNVSLEQNAGLHIHGGSFNVANQYKLQYHISAKGHTLLELRDMQMFTNAGVSANLTSRYQGSDDSRLHIENVQIDRFTSWLLCNLRDRARVETKNSPHFPSEIYPTGDSTVRIEGPRSEHAVWLHFVPGSTAVLDNLPASRPFTFSFGRNTPGVKGIGYQVDIVDGTAGFAIDSLPRSNVTVRNSHLGIGYHFSDVTTPETLTGLKGGGPQTATYRNQGRVLDLENAGLPPYGWQVYSSNDGVPLASIVPVTLTDSLINELGAANRGRFEVSHVRFGFAALAAIGPGSRVNVRDSIINSHTLMGDNDGVITIEDSEIYGSRVQAVGQSRILILNTLLRRNEPNPKCPVSLPSLDGGPVTRCNPYNPLYESEFLTRGQGAIWVAGIDPITQPIRPDSKYAFVGNALFKTADDKPYTYNLRYRQASASAFTAITTGAMGPVREQPLGQLDTTGLAPGDYIVQLELVVPGQDPVAVQRLFNITPPSSGAVPRSTPEGPAASQPPGGPQGGVPVSPLL